MLLALACPAGVGAAPSELSLDRVFGRANPWGEIPSRVQWAPDSRTFTYVLPSQDTFETLAVHEYDVSTGADHVLIDPSAFGAHATTPAALQWSADGKSLAFVERGTLYVRDRATGIDRTIADGAQDAQWSPKDDAIAYVHDDDLYVAYLGEKLRTVRLTTGGKQDVLLNGSLDWVYPEELSTQHGFEWSPDGGSIAYLQMDERPVTAFPIVDFLDTDNADNTEKYPLAGEKNPHVTLRLIDIASKHDRPIYDAGAKDEYVPVFGWKPQSHVLVAELLDRYQQNLRFVTFDDTGAAAQTLYALHDDKWLDEGVPLPVWLPNGDSVWLLHRDGTEGVYVRLASGDFKRLTGSYRTQSIASVDAKSGVVYASAAYPTRRDRSLIAVPLDGAPVRQLTPAPGSHGATLAPDFSAFVDVHSTLNDPMQADLVDVASTSVRATLAKESADLHASLLPVELLEVPSQYGPLDAWMIKPPGFDSRKKYPVIVYVYGGPGAPTTANAFDGQRELYHQLLARAGFVVFSVDGPASQVDSDEHVRLLYHNFGPGSLMGQEIGAKYLASLPYVDASRIGIWGWSFGGYETTYAMTHSTLFKAGAAVAPVTDWHYYDSIYTERYMGLPQDDPKAYDASSVLPAAKDLHGDLLISHGTSDDNVHMANTVSLLQQFVLEDKTNVDFMVYPRRTHSIAGVPQRRHLFEHMLDWWKTHL